MGVLPSAPEKPLPPRLGLPPLTLLTVLVIPAIYIWPRSDRLIERAERGISGRAGPAAMVAGRRLLSYVGAMMFMSTFFPLI